MGWFDELFRQVRETEDAFGAAPRLPSRQDQAVAEALASAARFVSGLGGTAPMEELRLTSAEAAALANATAGLTSLRIALLAALEGGMTMKLREEIETGRRRLEDGLADFAAVLRDGLRGHERFDATLTSELTDYLRQQAERLSVRKLLREATEARDETVRVRDDAQRAAGVVADTELAEEFKRYAAREERTANRLRAACMATLGLIAAVAFALIWHATGQRDLSAWEELARVGVTIPLGALAAYLGREASHHRQHARWAEQLVVQLRTLDAYCAPLADEQRAEMRIALGRRVFLSEIPKLGGGSGPEEGPADTLRVLQLATELARGPAAARA